MSISEALTHHIEGTGTGWEIDDLMSWTPNREEDKRAIDALLDIHERYRCEEYPIGVTNPASIPEMRELADRLRAEGQ